MQRVYSLPAVGVMSSTLGSRSQTPTSATGTDSSLVPSSATTTNGLFPDVGMASAEAEGWADRSAWHWKLLSLPPLTNVQRPAWQSRLPILHPRLLTASFYVQRLANIRSLRPLTVWYSESHLLKHGKSL